AHPGYDDYEGFGRRALDVPAATLQAQVEYQIGALIGLTTGVGGEVAYVKPHGGLYNAIVRDEAQAKVVVDAVRAIDDSLVFLGLAGSVANRIAAEAGLNVAAEAFADRAYNPAGSLAPRSEPNAVRSDPDAVAARVLRLVTTGQVQAIDGSLIDVDAQSICFHGDSQGSIDMARAARALLESEGGAISAFAGAGRWARPRRPSHRPPDHLQPASRPVRRPGGGSGTGSRAPPRGWLRAWSRRTSSACPPTGPSTCSCSLSATRNRARSSTSSNPDRSNRLWRPAATCAPICPATASGRTGASAMRSPTSPRSGTATPTSCPSSSAAPSLSNRA